MTWDANAFFTVHADLPREGPGDAESVARAMTVAGASNDWHVCDAACGPGDDIPALLNHVGTVTAFDRHGPFVGQARGRHGGNPNVQLYTAGFEEMPDFTPEGGFDAIWCAGALYFLGVQPGLTHFKSLLKPGGYVCFSEPCLFDGASQGARDFWDGYPTGTRADVLAAVALAGFEVLDDWQLSDAAWEAYYTPMEARLAQLKAGEVSDPVAQVIAEAEKEIAGNRRYRAETGYLMVVARVV